MQGSRGTHTIIRQTSRLVRQRIEAGGERLWRFADFADLPLASVAQALSRLARAGHIERLSKGTYYRGQGSTFGKSRPNPSAIKALATRRHSVFPAGIAAANLLDLTTQNPRQGEVATSSPSLPRKLVGDDTIIHTRRPVAWNGLSEADAALLDFFRRRGSTSELSPDETARRVLALVSDGDRFERLLKVAKTEPPRVRAILGALGEQLGKPAKILNHLRQTLNPLSRFDFGMLSGLRCARNWQAKEHAGRETV